MITILKLMSLLHSLCGTEYGFEHLLSEICYRFFYHCALKKGLEKSAVVLFKDLIMTLMQTQAATS